MENNELNNENVQNNTSQQLEQPNFSQIFNVESEEEIQQPEQVVVTKTQQQVVQNEEKPRRKVQATFNGEEEVLYTLKEEKEGNPLIPIGLVVFLICVVLLLPYISKRIEYRTFEPDPDLIEQGGSNGEEEIYEFNKSSTRAKIGSLELTNFVKSHENNDYLLSFTLNNVGEKSYDFSKKYYIVMYEDNKVIYRALIHSYDGLGALSATTLSLKISKSAFVNANKFKLEEIPTASYSSVKTVNVDGDYDVLTCVYNNNTVNYYFIDGELHKVYDEYEESKLNNVEYEANKNLYKNASEKYKAVEGISSIFIETETDFRMINEMELKNISDVTFSQLRTYRFFKYKESIKTVSFELEAQGYNCG